MKPFIIILLFLSAPLFAATNFAVNIIIPSTDQSLFDDALIIKNSAGTNITDQVTKDLDIIQLDQSIQIIGKIETNTDYKKLKIIVDANQNFQADNHESTFISVPQNTISSDNTLVTFIQSNKCACAGITKRNCNVRNTYDISILDKSTGRVLWGSEKHTRILDNSCSFTAMLGTKNSIPQSVLKANADDLSIELVDFKNNKQVLPFYGNLSQKGGAGAEGPKGKDGLNGTNGKDGLNGVNGLNGENGKDGLNGENGKDGLNGENGKDGIDGKNGKDGLNGKNGKDGIDGKNGKDGLNGENGLNGADGKDGIDGKNGLNGADGTDGIDGKNGLNGADGKDGENGDPGSKDIKISGNADEIFLENDQIFQGKTYTQKYIDELIANIPTGGQPGKDGIDGKNGANGKPGINGKDGINGLPGLNGKDGSNGKPGLNGKDGVNGLPGKDGQDGKNGVNGLPGKDGKDGKNGINGLPGKDGKDGKNGIKGDRGERGEAGPSGTSKMKISGDSDEIFFEVDQVFKGQTYTQAYIDAQLAKKQDKPTFFTKKNNSQAMQSKWFTGMKTEDKPNVWNTIGKIGVDYSDIITIQGQSVDKQSIYRVINTSDQLLVRVIDGKIQEKHISSEFNNLTLNIEVKFNL